MAKKTLTVGVNEILFNMINPDAKSLQVEQALMMFFKIDPVTLTPNITEYAGGAKPLTRVPESQIKTHQHTAPPPQQSVDGFAVSDAPPKPTRPVIRVTREKYDYLRNQVLAHPKMLAALEDEYEVDESL